MKGLFFKKKLHKRFVGKEAVQKHSQVDVVSRLQYSDSRNRQTEEYYPIFYAYFSSS